MPQTLKQLQSRKRKLERELREVEKDIAGIQSFARHSKLSKRLTLWTMVPTSELREWPDSLCKRFAGGFFRLRQASGAYSLYAKTKTGIVWHHVYRAGKYSWERVESC